ncbi:hypothetical protein [Streptomyces botrytidirepellens]|uniref:Uncharacterized protein n=1 Tax=Streptomyces botrytidirepellens TaxID=2486417 RepID=A0A3M8SIX3_9ACTN|nr:hypothetical protein [Streptomyces botrytidirepellens]RNF81149.1 hypothetical protein EEJ42_47050 [Streptomyces botrytidirepellens]
MTAGGGRIPANIWIRAGKDYYYSRGQAPDGTARLARLSRPPHGKTVYVIDPTGTLAAEKLPFELLGSAKACLILALLALVLIPATLGRDQDPIMAKVLIPIAVGLLFLAAYLCQTAHLYPHDAISRAEAEWAAAQAEAEAQREAAARAAENNARQAAQTNQWLAAIWAQNAAAQHHLDPNADAWRPYGQSPPL